MTYPIVELADDVPAQLEQLGTKPSSGFGTRVVRRFCLRRAGQVRVKIGQKKSAAKSVVCWHCHMQNMILLFGKVVGA